MRNCDCCRNACDLDLACLCACHDFAPYDADELGLDPELELEVAARSLNDRVAELLLRRPRYPGEIVVDVDPGEFDTRADYEDYMRRRS